MNDSNNSDEKRGNTSPSSPNKALVKKNKRYRKIVFTLNNYSEDEVTQITQEFTKLGMYIMGKEVAPKTGTPHIQGYVEFKKQVYFTTLKKIMPRANIQQANGTRAQNIKYCSKEGDFVSTFPPTLKEKLLKKYEDVKWHDWQQQVIDLNEQEPNDRTVNWFWEGKGGVGKSFLCKYLTLKCDAVIAEGKKADVFNQIKSWMEFKEEGPRTVILDIPRHARDYINYGCIEQVKNGLIYSGKYEGGICCFENPHVFIFANSPPDYDKFSEDRWNVIEI